MTEVVVAYVPVLHEGYHRFLATHGSGRDVFIVGPDLYADYRPLAKDIRCLEAPLVAASIASWGIAKSVAVLDQAGAEQLAAQEPAITLPDEDVSYRLTDQYFSRCAVLYDTTFLRWDKTRTARLLTPRPHRQTSEDEVIRDLAESAEAIGSGSADWWRQVGAAMRLVDGSVIAASNEHLPHRLSAYAVGDPRANFYKGVHLELSTSVHAEARLIAESARLGHATQGAVMYVTDFPCPPCAKLIAGAGVAKLYYRQGYAVLDGSDVLEGAGVEVVQVEA